MANKIYGQIIESSEQNTLKTYNEFENRIDHLTKSYLDQGYNKEQARNIANKIVSHEINYNHPASIRNMKAIEKESRSFNLDRAIVNKKTLINT